MFNGLSSSKSRPTGKAHVPGRGAFSSGIVSTSAGLVPRHSCGVRPRAHVNITPPSQLKRGCAAQPRPQSRRHVDPQHFTSLSDDAKREQGRYGKARVASSAQQKRAAQYYGNDRKPLAEQPPGQDQNLYLTSYYYTPLPAKETSPPPKMSNYSRSCNPQSTSVQLSEARLRAMQRTGEEHPGCSQGAAEALVQYRGDIAIVAAEEKLTRKFLAEEYAKSSEARVAELVAESEQRHNTGLGSPTPAIERSVPFALTDSTPRPDSANVAVHGIRVKHNRNKSSSPVEPREKFADRHLFDGPIPYDTIWDSGEAYPNPPPIGVSQPLFSKPTLVHQDPRRGVMCTVDADTLALKRARERGASSSVERQDFIFGPGPAPEGRKFQTLRQRTEARWKREETEQQERGTGRARAHGQYKSTALW